MAETWRKIDREWRERRDQVVRSLATHRLRLGDDIYLITITGQTGDTITGHAWDVLDGPR